MHGHIGAGLVVADAACRFLGVALVPLAQMLGQADLQAYAEFAAAGTVIFDILQKNLLVNHIGDGQIKVDVKVFAPGASPQVLICKAMDINLAVGIADDDEDGIVAGDGADHVFQLETVDGQGHGTGGTADGADDDHVAGRINFDHRVLQHFDEFGIKAVLGGLFGEAYAGGNGNPGHYVVALEMSPEKLKIGDFKYITKEKAKWSIKSKMQPKIAYIKDHKVVMDSLTKELLSELPV